MSLGVFLRKPWWVPQKPKRFLPVGVGDFYTRHIQGNEWELTLKNPIPQTAADVTTDWYFPFHHHLMRMYLKHTDGAGDPSNDSMDIEILHDIRGSLKRIWNRNGYVGSYILLDEIFWYSPARKYRIVSNTTALDLLEVNIELEALG